MKVIQSVIEEVKKGRNYLVFPEGELNRSNQLIDFHIILCRASALSRLWLFRRQHILDSAPFTFCELIPLRLHIRSLLKLFCLCNFYFLNKA